VVLLVSVKECARYAVVFVAAVIISSLFWNLNQFLLFRNLSYVEDYDYVVYLDDKEIKVKSGVTGQIDFVSEDFSQLMNFTVKRDNLKIFIKAADYNVSNPVLFKNVKSLKLVSNGARLHLNGNFLMVKGESWDNSKHNSIEGLTIINGSVILENCFMTTIKDCTFINSEEGVVLSNTNGWTECTKIEDCYFVNVRRGIIFKSPSENGTSSYANTEIKRCYFELGIENSVGMHIEPLSNFNEGLIQNVRFWMGEDGYNQTGILLEGSMLNTLMQDIVFESFADSPQSIYGIKLGPDCEPPIFGQGLIFCGNLTSSIYNPYGKWLYGAGGSFKVEDVSVPLGLNNDYGVYREIGLVRHLSLPASISNVKVRLEGEFSPGEVVTVRFRLKFIDNAFSKEVIVNFNQTETVWLNYDDILVMWPSRNIIASLIVDAKTTMNYSTVNILVSVYGKYG
jgi:hypothetical protein